MRAILFALVLGSSATILSACGIKGPLYLPEKPTAPPTAGADHNKAAPLPDQSQ